MGAGHPAQQPQRAEAPLALERQQRDRDAVHLADDKQPVRFGDALRLGPERDELDRLAGRLESAGRELPPDRLDSADVAGRRRCDPGGCDHDDSLSTAMGMVEGRAVEHAGSPLKWSAVSVFDAGESHT